VEGGGLGLIRVLSQNMAGNAEEIRKNSNQDSCSIGRV
jgi:hypothetical protein